ncbi:MAG: hypothetical protein J1F17_04495 [Oscillospiraceae bacterium]|nr:hypothetical protein [Oscillospiraceae bacterium]
MAKISLLYPENYSVNSMKMTDQAINDLSVDYLVDSLTKDVFEKNSIKNILTNINNDIDVINYRADVFEDILNFPQLRTGLVDLLGQLDDLREIEKFNKDEHASSLWQLINRLREIDGYVNCITMLKDILNTIPIKSDGLLSLKKTIEDIYSDGGFDDLKKDIDKTMDEARSLRSITIGVNLDNLLKPKNAGVISLNSFEITNSGLLKNFMNFASNKEELNSDESLLESKKLHPANPSLHPLMTGTVTKSAMQTVHIDTSGSATGNDPLSESLKKVVTSILKKLVKNIKITLQKYVHISGYALVGLMPEIIFYIRFAEIIDKMREKNLPVCKPFALDNNRCTVGRDIYNIKLAVKRIIGEEFEIVGNNIDFNSDQSIFVMTGPNRGGKTTFTQAVGHCYLLAQSGIYVPATEFNYYPVDNIYTHFPADENDTVDLGRLGEESKRLSEIFQVATDKSLILLNESLATTNVAEGVFIAKDVIRAMSYLGTRAIFNTHMHELAHRLEDYNSDNNCKSKVQSLVTGIKDGVRSFKCEIAPPQGVSYAREIAEKYGVTFSQIKESIDKRCDE